MCVGGTGGQWPGKVTKLKEFYNVMPSNDDGSYGASAALSLQHAQQKKDARVNRIHVAPINL